MIIFVNIKKGMRCRAGSKSWQTDYDYHYGKERGRNSFILMMWSKSFVFVRLTILWS